MKWADLERQPGWRTDRDLLYLGLEARAQAWHTAQQTKHSHKAQEKQDFDTWRQQMRTGRVSA